MHKGRLVNTLRFVAALMAWQALPQEGSLLLDGLLVIADDSDANDRVGPGLLQHSTAEAKQAGILNTARQVRHFHGQTVRTNPGICMK